MSQIYLQKKPIPNSFHEIALMNSFKGLNSVTQPSPFPTTYH